MTEYRTKAAGGRKVLTWFVGMDTVHCVRGGVVAGACAAGHIVSTVGKQMIIIDREIIDG